MLRSQGQSVSKRVVALLYGFMGFLKYESSALRNVVDFDVLPLAVAVLIDDPLFDSGGKNGKV